MHPNHVEELTRFLAEPPSRRDLLRTLTGGSLALLVRLPLGESEAEARKKRKKHHKKNHKKKKPQPPPPPLPPPLPPPAVNAFGCVDVGQACRGDSALCCSGICEGSPPAQGQADTSVCVAHNAGICTPRHDTCAAGVSVSCNSNSIECYCTMTTGNAPFCGDFFGGGGGPAALCRVCNKDSDCEAEFGPGAACVLLDEACTAICPDTGGAACVPTCA